MRYASPLLNVIWCTSDNACRTKYNRIGNTYFTEMERRLWKRWPTGQRLVAVAWARRRTGLDQRIHRAAQMLSGSQGG